MSPILEAKPVILGLSDVALGYGSPQFELILKSLSERYPSARTIAVEPDQKGRLPRMVDGLVDVVRVATHLPPYDGVFQVEYNLSIHEIIAETKPAVIVVSHGWVLPAVLRSRHRPSVLIYYMLESIEHQVKGMGRDAIDLNRWCLALADLVLVPERRRAAADMRAQGWDFDRLIEICNVSEPQPTLPANLRNGKVLYAGGIGHATLSGYMAAEALSAVEFEVAGPAETVDGKEVLSTLVCRPNIRYIGLLSAAELRSVRAQFAYSIVMWRPDGVNQLYASPNKFFESIAAGVPPICTPHPQCVEFIERYDCGIVVDSWNEHDFIRGVQKAMDIYHTNPARYATLVRNCNTAFETELNWKSQFEKIAPYLPEAL